MPPTEQLGNFFSMKFCQSVTQMQICYHKILLFFGIIRHIWSFFGLNCQYSISGWNMEKKKGRILTIFKLSCFEIANLARSSDRWLQTSDGWSDFWDFQSPEFEEKWPDFFLYICSCLWKFGTFESIFNEKSSV